MAAEGSLRPPREPGLCAGDQAKAGDRPGCFGSRTAGRCCVCAPESQRTGRGGALEWPHVNLKGPVQSESGRAPVPIARRSTAQQLGSNPEAATSTGSPRSRCAWSHDERQVSYTTERGSKGDSLHSSSWIWLFWRRISDTAERSRAVQVAPAHGGAPSPEAREPSTSLTGPHRNPAANVTTRSASWTPHTVGPTLGEHRRQHS